MDKPAPVDYALIQHGAVYQVAWALEGAAGAALSISELADRYTHSMPSDLYRVKKHNKLATNKQAEEWIVRRAVAFLAKWLVIENDTIRFREGVTFDKLRFDGEPIPRNTPDIHAQLHDPFDPMSGKFSENIRIDLGDLTELRQSMKDWGWIDRPQFRAIGDKRGRVVLTGHRRIAVAKELGIDWEKHIDWLEFGEGDAADAERFKLAIASNLGGKPLSPNDRKRLAEHLYGEKDWSMQRVADALGVAVQTVSNDLREFPTSGKSKRGRPRVKKDALSPQAERALETIGNLANKLGRDPTYSEVEEAAEVSSTPVRVAFTLYRSRPAPAPQQTTEPHTCPTCGQPWPHKENGQ